VAPSKKGIHVVRPLLERRAAQRSPMQWAGEKTSHHGPDGWNKTYVPAGASSYAPKESVLFDGAPPCEALLDHDT
jgi:hypothetical protein